MTMPLVFAGDPAPQQLTAPCRKYSGRSHPPIEQAPYRRFFKYLQAPASARAHRIVSPITVLIRLAISGRRSREGLMTALIVAVWLAAGSARGQAGTVQEPEGKVTGRVVDA